MKTIGRLLDAAFPKSIYCICCGSVIDGTRVYSLCDKCMDRIRWVTGRTCEKCGRPVQEDYLHNTCTECRKTSHYYDRGFTCAEYGIYEKAVVSALKYEDKSYIGRILGDIMADRIEGESIDFEVIVPVPVHADRMEKRGYNQAALAAKRLGRRTDTPVDEYALKRIRHTARMKNLGAAGRAENISGAFAAGDGAGERLAGRKVLLVDDVYTTGSTADECARVLKEAGAASVDVLTFAAGGNLILPSSYFDDPGKQSDDNVTIK